MEARDALGALYGQLAPRLASGEHRQLLRELLDQLQDGGGEAVRTEIQARLKEILTEEL